MHKFKVSHLGSHDSSPKFYFFFNDKKELQKVKLEQSLIGGFEFDALYPIQERKYNNILTKHSILGFYTAEDFEYEECDEISSIILDEAKTFVSFMQSIVEELIGSEDYMLNLLKGKTTSSS